MNDLYLGLAIMVGLTVVLGLGTWWLAGGAKNWLLDLLAGVVILAIVGFVFLLRDNIVLARWLPYSNLVIVGNWLPLFAGMLAGLLVRRIKGRPTSQFLWSTLLIVTGFSAMVDPFRNSPPVCSNQKFDICRGCADIGGHEETLTFHLQTSPVTCSPAAACTLLGDYGIVTDEATLARDSLTRHGTTWQGLYRGLKLATRGTDWDVEVFETDYESLIEMPGPKLLFVELPEHGDYEEIYTEQYGWSPGQRHTVVFYNPRYADRVVIGDPSVGVEEWTLRDMEVLWQGRGMRLVRRGAEGDGGTRHASAPR